MQNRIQNMINIRKAIEIAQRYPEFRTSETIKKLQDACTKNGLDLRKELAHAKKVVEFRNELDEMDISDLRGDSKDQKKYASFYTKCLAIGLEPFSEIENIEKRQLLRKEISLLANTKNGDYEKRLSRRCKELGLSYEIEKSRIIKAKTTNEYVEHNTNKKVKDYNESKFESERTNLKMKSFSDYQYYDTVIGIDNIKENDSYKAEFKYICTVLDLDFNSEMKSMEQRRNLRNALEMAQRDPQYRTAECIKKMQDACEKNGLDFKEEFKNAKKRVEFKDELDKKGYYEYMDKYYKDHVPLDWWNECVEIGISPLNQDKNIERRQTLRKRIQQSVGKSVDCEKNLSKECAQLGLSYQIEQSKTTQEPTIGTELMESSKKIASKEIARNVKEGNSEIKSTYKEFESPTLEIDNNKNLED